MEIPNREILILRLLTTFHLNNVEWIIFFDNPITLQEIEICIQEELNKNLTFPPTVNDSDGFEGYYIKKLVNGNFDLIWQRNHPLNPFKTIEKLNKKYTNFKKLIIDYLDKEFNFNIDGISVKK